MPASISVLPVIVWKGKKICVLVSHTVGSKQLPQTRHAIKDQQVILAQVFYFILYNDAHDTKLHSGI